MIGDWDKGARPILLFRFFNSQGLHPRCQCCGFDAEQFGGTVCTRDLAIGKISGARILARSRASRSVSVKAMVADARRLSDAWAAVIIT